MGAICTETYPDPVLEEWPAGTNLIIFDLEFTAWEGSHQRDWSEPWEYREIIQIGAVHVAQGRDNLVVDGELDILVRPTVNPELSDYITNLTGITNVMIDGAGVPFLQALHFLEAFVDDDDLLLCNGLDGVILRENCIINAIDYPFSPDKIANLRPVLANVMGTPEPEVVSSELPKLLGLTALPGGHTGVRDAKCILTAVTEMRRLEKL